MTMADSKGYEVPGRLVQDDTPALVGGPAVIAAPEALADTG